MLAVHGQPVYLQSTVQPVCGLLFVVLLLAHQPAADKSEVIK